jgi:hypothetical protein
MLHVIFVLRLGLRCALSEFFVWTFFLIKIVLYVNSLLLAFSVLALLG